MKTDTNSPPPPLTSPRRKRLVMTKADWERVERSVQKAEHEPDPAQGTLIDLASVTVPRRDADA
jgi:hypothetical protein